MRSIKSVGGPLIGLHREVAPHWGGSSEKSFFTESASLSDYDSIGDLMDRCPEPVNSLVVTRGGWTAFFLAVPLETAIVSEDKNGIKIAQVHFAPQSWRLNGKVARLFDGLSFSDRDSLEARPGRYVIFDAAFQLSELGGDVLEFDLAGGGYTLSSAVFSLDIDKSLILSNLARV